MLLSLGGYVGVLMNSSGETDDGGSQSAIIKDAGNRSVSCKLIARLGVCFE